MRRSKLLPLVAATVAVLGASGVASASGVAAETRPSEGTTLTVKAGGQCTGSWVDVSATVIAQARPAANSGDIFPIYAGETFPCRKLVVGGAYQACGYTGANGWILVQDGIKRHDGYAGWLGYIPSVCTADE
jgi:hypothetical protein